MKDVDYEEELTEGFLADIEILRETLHEQPFYQTQKC